MNKNQNQEGYYYASKLRLFLNEYGGINLHEFCNIEKVSYTKMLNLLGGESYTSLPKKDNLGVEVHSQPELPIRELVIDLPVQQSSKSPIPIKRVNAAASKSVVIEDVELSFRNKFDIRFKRCDVSTLLLLVKEMGGTAC